MTQKYPLGLAGRRFKASAGAPRTLLSTRSGESVCGLPRETQPRQGCGLV